MSNIVLKIQYYCTVLHIRLQSLAHNWLHHIYYASLRRVHAPLSCFATRPIWSTNPFLAPQSSIGIGIRLISHSSCRYIWRRKGRWRWYIFWLVGRSHWGARPFRQPQHTIGHFLSSVRLRKWSDLSSPIVPGPLRGAWPARQVPNWPTPSRWNWIWFDVQFYSIPHTAAKQRICRYSIVAELPR